MPGSFFKLSNVIPISDAINYLKKAIDKSYGKKGSDIVKMNYEAVDRGINSLVKVEIPSSWANAKDKEVKKPDEPEFITKILRVMNRHEGDNIPVSALCWDGRWHFPIWDCSL